VLAGFYNNSPK